MRHAILLPVVFLTTVIAWRIGTYTERGRAQHDKEIEARGVMVAILRAEEERRLQPPRETTHGAIFGYLSDLVAEGGVSGLVPVPDSRVEIYRSGDYLFHVSLLNRLNYPLRLPPADRAADRRFGERFEAWAWPAEPSDTQLVLYFGSTSGTLLQGENGVSAGAADFPGDEFTSESPLQQHVHDGDRDTRWVEVFALSRK